MEGLGGSELKNDIWRLSELARERRFSLHTLVYALSDLTRCSIYCMNRAGYMICGKNQQNYASDVGLDLIFKGYLDEEQLRRYRSGGVSDDPVPSELIPMTLKNGSEFLVLLFGSLTYAGQIRDALLSYLNAQISGQDLLMSPSEIEYALSDVCLRKAETAGAIAAALQDNRKRPYYCPLVIDFDDSPPDSTCTLALIRDLKKLTHTCKATRLQGHLVCLLTCEPNRDDSPYILKSRWEESAFSPPYSFADLEALLEQHRAHAAVNSATMDLELLPELVEFLMEALEIGRKFSLVMDFKRIHHLEDYQVILIEKKYVEEHIRSSNVRALKYLFFPELLALIKHDKDTHQELTKLLFYYLSSGCDVQRTAKTVYMHKNTVYSKIKQIKELIRIDFRDIKFASSLLDSLKLFYFVRDYFDIDMSVISDQWLDDMQDLQPPLAGLPEQEKPSPNP